ncbi:MAG TPA: hypothetical protein VGO60_12610, partial [Iamia sp.]|nr:hypothetical protein [Iamia sp.]
MKLPDIDTQPEEDEMTDPARALLTPEEGDQWEAEIQEAILARRQAQAQSKANPRPKTPRGMMQRRSFRTPGRARSTTPSTPSTP